MNRLSGYRSVWLVVILPLLTACSPADQPEAGFAGLGAQLEGRSEEGPDFLQPAPGDRVSLPRDLGPHPQHRFEWWYLTANLTTSEGVPLGLQWTQFRQALQPRSPEQAPPPADEWPLQSAWMANAAISYQGEHVFQEKLARGDIGHAGARAEPFQVWLDDWRIASLVAEGEDSDHERWALSVNTRDWHYDLELSPRRDPVKHGKKGFALKSETGQASMYFSYVDLAISGTVTIAGKTHRVAGEGWFDREWSSQFLQAEQEGWDWMALHLDSGDKLMVYRLRKQDGSSFRFGTWIPRRGKPRALRGDQLTFEVAGSRQTELAEVPVEWRVRVPLAEVDIRVEALPGNYWNRGVFPYWESPVRVWGSHQGRGYLELTGYGDTE
ncbi:MAG: carotenoid 1,2-hydratase [Oleiphilaceae bacterium]|nr:carotenoid 1,2-hydratase [Oleiphilaceae bacterium]